MNTAAITNSIGKPLAIGGTGRTPANYIFVCAKMAPDLVKVGVAE